MASLAPLSSWTAIGVTRALAAVRRVQPPANSFLAGPSRRDVATLVSQPLRFRSKSPGTSLSARCFSALSPEMKSTIDKVVQSHKVVLFMKGTKDFPQCGFSNTVVQILKSLNVPFETLNILENDMLRQGMKEYSSWPTFPQLYIDGEFFGGCDITIVATILEYAIIERELGSGKMSVSRIDTKRSCSAEAYKNGQLQEQIEKAMCS